MPGYLYYIAVSAAGLALAVYVIYKKKSYAKLISFYLFATVLSFCGEALVLLLKAYSYKIGVFASPDANNILGHILLNSTLWPAIAVFISAYSPRFRWIIAISFGFLMLDIIFTQLGVYQHNWWQSWMSGIAVFIYCILIRFSYSKLEDSKFKILRFISFSFVFFFIMFMPSVILLLTGHQFYSIGIFNDKYKDSSYFSFVLHGALAPVCIPFLCILNRWYWKLVPFIIFFACDLLLAAFGVLNFFGGWNVFYLLIIRAICILIFITLENRYSYNLVKQA